MYLIFFLFLSYILKLFLEVLTDESLREMDLLNNVTFSCIHFKHSLLNARHKFTELTKCLRKYRFTNTYFWLQIDWSWISCQRCRHICWMFHLARLRKRIYFVPLEHADLSIPYHYIWVPANSPDNHVDNHPSYRHTSHFQHIYHI